MKVNKKAIRHILLLGASVGEAWDFPGLPMRLNQEEYKFEYKGKYSPDKSDLVEAVILRKENKPDAVIIKQCAAYIPSGNKEYDPTVVEKYRELAVKWVDQLRENDIIPILATIVPITEKAAFKVRVKRWVRTYILWQDISPYYRDIRLKGICDYNDWAKAYAKNQNIMLLDLESAVRVDEKNRFLSPELTTDGLHLNKKAYERLDLLAGKTLFADQKAK